MDESNRIWSEYLQSQEWQFFFTITCRNERRDRLALLRDIKEVLHEDCHQAAGFIAIEPHFTGLGIHAHGICRNHVEADEVGFSASDIWQRSFNRFGRSKVSAVKAHADVAAYCSKYVSKKMSEYDYWDYDALIKNKYSHVLTRVV